MDQGSSSFRWRASDQMYSTAGMPGTTNKLTISRIDNGQQVEHGLYLHRAYFEGQLNFFDITCDGSFDYTTRRLITMICGYVRRELRHGILTEEELVGDWRGLLGGTNSFEPQGYCKEINRNVCSPLDAVARYMEIRRQDAQEEKEAG